FSYDHTPTTDMYILSLHDALPISMAHLDVIVIDSQSFQTAALVQIAGRTGRKLQDTSGLVLFLHNGVTLSMVQAKRQIKQMNQLDRKSTRLNSSHVSISYAVFCLK